MNGQDDFYWASKLFPVTPGPPVEMYVGGSYPPVPTITTRGVFLKHIGRAFPTDQQHVRGQLLDLNVDDCIFSLNI